MDGRFYSSCIHKGPVESCHSCCEISWISFDQVNVTQLLINAEGCFQTLRMGANEALVHAHAHAHAHAILPMPTLPHPYAHCRYPHAQCIRVHPTYVQMYIHPFSSQIRIKLLTCCSLSLSLSILFYCCSCDSFTLTVHVLKKRTFRPHTFYKIY